MGHPKQKANLFKAQFSKVFSKPDEPFTVPPPSDSAGTPQITSILVSKRGVLQLLKSIDGNKATGPDQIPGKLLKTCANELAGVFAILFQASLDQGIVPDDWKLALISPLFKKADKNNVENYRPILLTSVV